MKSGFFFLNDSTFHMLNFFKGISTLVYKYRSMNKYMQRSDPRYDFLATMKTFLLFMMYLFFSNLNIFFAKDTKDNFDFRFQKCL